MLLEICTSGQWLLAWLLCYPGVGLGWTHSLCLHFAKQRWLLGSARETIPLEDILPPKSSSFPILRHLLSSHSITPPYMQGLGVRVHIWGVGRLLHPLGGKLLRSAAVWWRELSAWANLPSLSIWAWMLGGGVCHLVRVWVGGQFFYCKAICLSPHQNKGHHLLGDGSSCSFGVY